MAFPTLVDTTTSAVTSNSNPLQFNYPSTVNSGDLLLAVVNVRAINTGLTWDTAGWTEITESGDGSGGMTFGWKDATGSESGTFDIGNGGVTTGTCQVFRITGAEDPSTQAPEVQCTARGSGNAPALTPTGGAEDFLWILIGANRTDDYVSEDEPTGEDWIFNVNISATTTSQLGSAYKNLNASSLDPGTWSQNSSTSFAATIAVHPAAAATGVGRLVNGGLIPW